MKGVYYKDINCLFIEYLLECNKVIRIFIFSRIIIRENN